MLRRVLAPGLMLGFGSWLIAADAPPADFPEYRTVDPAQTTEHKPTSCVPMPPAHLGINIESEKGKLVVARVETGSAAEAAGVKPGDVLKALDGQKFSNVEALRQFLVTKFAGQAMVVDVERGGQNITLA